MTRDPEILERNVETLLEAGGEAPKLSELSRARIRASLVAAHGRTAGDAMAARKVISLDGGGGSQGPDAGQHDIASSRRAPSVRRPTVAVAGGLCAAAVIAIIATRLLGGPNGDVGPGSTSGHTDELSWVTDPSGGRVTILGPRHARVDGNVLIDVVPGKGIYTVETPRGTIEVLGTRFYVEASDTRTTASVVRGEVKLATAGGNVVLHAGEQGVAVGTQAPTRGPAQRLSHLVSWAEQIRSREGEASEPVHHGTLFARDPGVRSHPPWGAEYPLPMTKLGVDVVVDHQVARVALDQTFHNEQDQVLEGVYRFAIPPDAALQRLAMYVDGKLTESAVVERMRARRIYEELVYRRVDPALLEWAGTGRLDLRVYPLPAREDKRLMLAYTQSLPRLYDDWTLTVPLPEVDRPVGELDISVRVKDCASCDVSSTSHRISVSHDGSDAVVRYTQQAVSVGDSLVLRVRDNRREARVATARDGDDRFVMVRAPAVLERGDAKPYRPHSWVILDDVSASRSVAERKAQSSAVAALLHELDENDRVAIVAFDVMARDKLAMTRVLDVDHKAVATALASEGGVGATDFRVGLEAAMRALGGIAPDDATIVYLGDGVITAGPRHLDELRGVIAGKARFVGVGIGDGPDTQTLGALAAATGGYTTNIDLADDIGWRVFDLVAALHTPRVTGIEASLVDDDGAKLAATTYLASPQLADGEELELVAKLDASHGRGSSSTMHAVSAVELTGTLDGAPWHRRVQLGRANDDAGYVPRLWAQRHIAARLLAKHEPVACVVSTRPCPPADQAREQRDEEIRKDVVALGTKYFLLSRHTSLLVLENDDMYRKFDVTKGSGEMWAPYAMPPTIAPHPGTIANGQSDPVTGSTVTATNADMATTKPIAQTIPTVADAPGDRDEALRERTTRGPMLGERGGDEMMLDGVIEQTEIGGFGTATPTIAAGFDVSAKELRSVDSVDDIDAHLVGVLPAQQLDVGLFDESEANFKRQLAFGQTRFHAQLQGQQALRMQVARAMPFWLPASPGYMDLAAFVPALTRDTFETARKQLDASPGPHTIDAAARALLTSARTSLAAGVYRWDDLELAIARSQHLGWRRTTLAGLDETSSFDGSTWTRTYTELGLGVTRAVADDDVVFQLAYLPLWIAPADHYAKWFDVTASGRRVTLSTTASGRRQVAYQLDFDDHDRVVAVIGAHGEHLAEITYGAVGPTSAKLRGQPITVGFAADGIGDVAAWAHRGVKPEVVVERTDRDAASWAQQLARDLPRTPAWRQAQRQRMAALVMTRDRRGLVEAFDALAASGGVTTADVVLASSALAADPNRLADRVSGLASKSGVARYLLSLRSNERAATAGVSGGLIGSLWSLRDVTVDLASSHPGENLFAATKIDGVYLREAAVQVIQANWSVVPVATTLGVLDALAVGSLRNVAREAAANVLRYRGDVEGAATRIVALVDDLDLTVRPPDLVAGRAVVAQSRRGAKGWDELWAKWRDRVVAGPSLEHTLALLDHAAEHPADVAPILAHAEALAATDSATSMAVAYRARQLGQLDVAVTIADRVAHTSEDRAAYQLVGEARLAAGRYGEALESLVAAQNAARDGVVPVATLRREMTQLIAVAGKLAMASVGPARASALATAEQWAARWRDRDPGNATIDQTLAAVELSLNNTGEAWRQLSTVIERDPMSGRGYSIVADTFERAHRTAEALDYWHMAIVIDQTNPTPRLRRAQALIALGRDGDADAQLREIVDDARWHDVWSGVVGQARNLLARGGRPSP